MKKDLAPNSQLNPKSGLHLDYSEYLIKHTNDKLRQFLLIGPINENAFAVTSHTLQYMAAQNSRPILVMLNTYGGDINAGLAIYDLIRSLNGTLPIDIKATGACMSMGAIILQAGRRRLATPHVHFMLHQLRGVNEGDLGEQRDRYRHMEHLQKTLNKVLATRTGHSAKQIDKLIDRKDYYISAPEALKINLIDKIEN